jgi:hypothetical protein
MLNGKKIHIYNRHFSRNRRHPERPEWFNYEKTFVNLLATTNFDLCDLTVIFEKEEDYGDYFVRKYEKERPFKVKFVDTSREKWIGKTNEDAGWSRGIAAASSVIMADSPPDDELISICDDDYIHVRGWAEACIDYIDNFLPKDKNFFVCPCDYGDKYYFIDEKHTIDQYGTDQGMYADLESRIRISNHCYWREVPNCMMSSIVPSKTFRRDYNDYWSKGYSDCGINYEIKKRYGTKFWTPMPSLSCHATYPFISPFIDWKRLIS